MAVYVFCEASTPASTHDAQFTQLWRKYAACVEYQAHASRLWP